MQTTTNPSGADARLATAEEAIASLGQAVGSLRCAGSQRLVRLGISMTHFHVLTLLRHHDAMPMGRLADTLDASVSSATGIIDRMEERGLVERERVPDDRRVVLVRPTKAGLRLVDDAELVRSDVIRAALARMTLDQLERLTATIGELAGALETEMASDPARYGPVALCDQERTPHATHRRPAPSPGDGSPTTGTAGA